MLLPPRRTVRTGVIFSVIDGPFPDMPKNERKGARCGALWTDAATAQSIFQAEKITLGTAGSPAGFL